MKIDTRTGFYLNLTRTNLIHEMVEEVGSLSQTAHQSSILRQTSQHLQKYSTSFAISSLAAVNRRVFLKRAWALKANLFKTPHSLFADVGESSEMPFGG